jgi:hypothetical protein
MLRRHRVHVLEPVHPLADRPDRLAVDVAQRRVMILAELVRGRGGLL